MKSQGANMNLTFDPATKLKTENNRNTELDRLCPVKIPGLIYYKQKYYQQETYIHHSGFICPDEN